MSQLDAYTHLKLHLPNAMWQRVENSVGVGTPDVFGIRDGICAWIELKSGSLVEKRGGTFLLKVSKKELRPAQNAWHREYYEHGGRSAIAIVAKDRRGAPGVWVIRYNFKLWDNLAEGLPLAYLPWPSNELEALFDDA